jgi:uncharacterized protein YndB with AHSA1/START domain
MTTPRAAPRQTTIERLFDAPLDDVWDLWTTKDGIESWWGPDGFTVEVRALDLRPGGELRYAMIATAAPQIAFMKQAGMPLVTEARITYTEVTPRRRLAYDHLADFIPGVAPYLIGHTVELEPTAAGVHMRLTIDAMHDDTWTERAVMGWASELGKLAAQIAARQARPVSP